MLKDQVKTVVYHSSRGYEVALSLTQIAKLEAAGVWPRDQYGNEACMVAVGEQYRWPTFTDEQVQRIVNGENATDIR